MARPAGHSEVHHPRIVADALQDLRRPFLGKERLAQHDVIR